jgi:DNA-binding MarR family transcriptional regulator
LRDDLLEKISEIEKSGIHKKEPEPKIKSAIPIKREKALDPLTETELTVLKLLASEGEKTAPNIKSRIMLSREHTARLMKKLYTDGYLERSANRIPFKYRLKEEMQKILGSPDQRT